MTERDPNADAPLANRPWPDGAAGRMLVLALLVLGLVVRAVYAYDLPRTADEVDHLAAAQRISLHPDRFHVPLSSPASTHPPGVLYLTSLALWAGGGSLFAVRFIFVGLSLLGLVGLYMLARTLFGSSAALLALALAAIDRHLVASAGIPLESPAVMSMAPWAILAMWRSVEHQRTRDWLLLGLALSLGFWLSTLFLVMLLPLGLFVLLTGRLRQVLASGWMYAGLMVFVAATAPYFVSDLHHSGLHLERNVDKVGAIGLSPRFVLLYIGDLLICLKDPLWVLQHMTVGVYSPNYIPCHWLAGSLYLAAIGAAVFHWRNRGVLLLLAVIGGFLVPVTLLDAREPWNEFTWASATVWMAIALCGFFLQGALSWPWGKVAVGSILAVAAVCLGAFLSGPKWGYFCPDGEVAFVGRFAIPDYRARWNPDRFSRDAAAAEMRDLAMRTVREHGDSAVAWFALGVTASDPKERAECFRHALELAPNAPMIIEAQAHDLTEAGDWGGAKQLLESLVGQGRESFDDCLMLAIIERHLGNQLLAVRYAHRALHRKPEDPLPHRELYLAYGALGAEAKAAASLRTYVSKSPSGPVDAYIELAEECFEQDQMARGKRLLELSLRAGPATANQRMRAGILFVAHLNDLDQAIRQFRAAVELAPENAIAFFNLARAFELKGDSANAVRCYEHSLRLDPTSAKARRRLRQLNEQTGQPKKGAGLP